MSKQDIHWHLDSTVWQRAFLGGPPAMAEIWVADDGGVGWAVFAPSGPDEVAYAAEQGTGADEADAKAQAEAALRRVAR